MAADGASSAASADAHRGLVRARILRGARAELAARGLSVRVEDVADAAGVSRRTVFRYFPTREALLAAALEESMRSYGEHVPRPLAGQSLEQWLGAAVAAVHRMNAQHGQVYFELASGAALDGELARITRARRRARRQLVDGFTATAWELAGGTGAPPQWVHDTVAVLLSAFATEALGPDFGRTPDQIAASLTPALMHALRGAVADERGGG
ncbi:TetR/AcrR family transcriptional regulator [Actinomarinicola tropica]|uniref:TetR family transcriptional regulator n=1 Tax=Actinomarinicola tropica TaxID=2789776 RepID=A0A5Q2RAY5_9ACTN|nr:TetR/AcrR family transcriptional regulator [Actinomarinicola tropica]QGG94029.1 TetR family transcriptional regulator [Actinomarinicola tropica]